MHSTPLIQRRLTLLPLASAALFLLAAGPLPALTLTYDPTNAPATNVRISQTDSTGGLVSNQDYTDNGGPPGQTFTPSSAFTLQAITVQGGNSAGNYLSANFTIQIGQVNTVTGQITELDNETASGAPVSNATGYLTFTLATPVVVSAGTVYSFSILTSNGYYGFSHSTSDVYAGGTAFNNDANTTQAGNAAPTRTFNGFVSPRSYDYTFYATGTVPEPGAALMLGLGALSFFGLRRPSRHPGKLGATK